LPNLFSQISDDYPSFDPNNISLTNIHLHKIQGIDSYDKFICMLLDIHCEADELISKHEIYRKSF